MDRVLGVAGLAALLLTTASCSSAPPPGQSVPAAASAPTSPPRASLTLPASPLSDEQRIVHALNRLGYGPRPGDVERVRRMGLAVYIEQQLHPGRMADPAVEQALIGCLLRVVDSPSRRPL